MNGVTFKLVGFCLVAVGRLERWKDFRGGFGGEAAGRWWLDGRRGSGGRARGLSPQLPQITSLVLV